MTEPEPEAIDSEKTRPRRRLRRARKSRKDQPVRSQTEWVDDLYADEPADASGTGSPFDTPAPAPEPDLGPKTTGIDEALDPYAHDADAQARRDRRTQRTRERDAWRRRSTETHDQISFFVDNVLGTQNDPRLRRRRHQPSEFGLVQADPNGRLIEARVEGLDRDIPLALPFPHDEFRGARLVYETDGGYVLEIHRAIGGDAGKQESQFYTVSRMGDVEHVLDRLRRAEELRAAKTLAESDLGAEPLPDFAPSRDAPAEPAPALAPAPVDGREPHDAHEPGTAAPATPGPAPHDRAAMDAHLADQPADQGTPQPPAPEEDEAASGKKSRFGFGRRRHSEGDADASDEPANEDPAPVAEAANGTERSGKFRLSFGRKRPSADDDAPEASASSDQ